MVSTKVLLLQLLLVSVVSAQQHFMGLNTDFSYKGMNPDGTHKVLLRHSFCSDNCSSTISWYCILGNCGSISNTQDTEIDQSLIQHLQRKICVIESVVTRTISSDEPFKLATKDCCWPKSVEGASAVTGVVALSLGKRSDTGEPNKTPDVGILPYLTVPRNCPREYKTMPFDADGDKVRCRRGIFEKEECSLCEQPAAGFHLDQDSCIFSYNITDKPGIYTFEGVKEDYSKKRVEMIYTNGPNPQKLEGKNKTKFPLSRLPLQFTMEVTEDVLSCKKGVFLPKLLPPTPRYGAKIHAELNSTMEFRVKAKASHSKIKDLSITGPSGISHHPGGKNEFIVKWTPTADDVGEHFPICFAVVSARVAVHPYTRIPKLLLYQSEMRCVLVEVKEKIGKSHVICNESSMTIVVEKDSFPGLSEDNLRLNDPSNTDCSLESNGTHIMSTFSLNQCGTEIEEDDEFLIFKNEITTYEDPNSDITRSHLLEVQFFCQYPKHGNVSQSFLVHRKNVTVWEKGMGEFTYEFEFFKDDSYKTMIDPYLFPLEVEIGSRLFMKIEATSSLNNTELFVESCTAAPFDNPNYPKPYTIIEDGCEVDPTVDVYEIDHKNQFLFSMEAFKFIGLHDQVYISCSVIMCEAGNPNTRCSQGCINSTTSAHRSKRETKVQSGTHFVSQGPLRMKRSAENSDSPAIALNLNLVLIAGCVLAAVGMICGVIMYRIKPSKVKYQPLPTSETL